MFCSGSVSATSQNPSGGKRLWHAGVYSFHEVTFSVGERKIVLERMYHLTDGPFEQWVYLALGEVQWLGSAIKLGPFINPSRTKYCPCCQKSMANTIDTNVATRPTAPDWSDE